MDRLQSKQSKITKIREVFGTPSLSCGVLHYGEIVFRHSEEYADVQKELLADANTVYCIASCSKGFVSALCNILANEGKLSWEAPVSQYLPKFQTAHDPEVGKRATLLNLCSHGTGLAPLDRVGCGFFDEFYNKGSEQVHISANLPVCYDLRSRWLYNNFMLGVVGEVISVVSGQGAGSVMKEKVFRPLGFNRTCTAPEEYPSDGNVAIGYSLLDDGSLIPHDDPGLRDGSVQGASGFVRSTVNDMLCWAKAVIDAECGRDTPSAGKEGFEGVGHVLGNIQTTRCAHRPITFDGGTGENSYGLGWFRYTLPSKYLGSIGPNFSLLQDPPVIGQANQPRLKICHYGEFGGFVSSFYTFPDTCSAIVVMANSSPSRGDPTDLVAQLLIQELFSMKPELDLESFATRTVQTAQMIWPALVEDWVSNRIQQTVQPPLKDFIGAYHNQDFFMKIEVYELPDHETGPGPSPELLGFKINSLEKQKAKLRHYHYDVWTFLPNSRDDAVRKGLEGYMLLPMLLFSFTRDAKGEVRGFDWDLQAGACEGLAPRLEAAVSPVRFVRN